MSPTMHSASVPVYVRMLGNTLCGLEQGRGPCPGTKHFVLPNFYFHVTTTYALLRHGGVELGKRDYLGAA